MNYHQHSGVLLDNLACVHTEFMWLKYLDWSLFEMNDCSLLCQWMKFVVVSHRSKTHSGSHIASQRPRQSDHSQGSVPLRVLAVRLLGMPSTTPGKVSTPSLSQPVAKGGRIIDALAAVRECRLGGGKSTASWLTSVP